MIKQDKAMHFGVGFIIGFIISIISAIFYIFTQPTLGFVCLLASLVVGIVKECFDYFYQKEKFDWFDILATTLGGGIFWFA
jgi:hypothetical protein